MQNGMFSAKNQNILNSLMAVSLVLEPILSLKHTSKLEDLAVNQENCLWRRHF